VFRGRREPYRLSFERGDALRIVHALRGAVRPELELRFCWDSWGGTVVEFMPLTAAQWATLEAVFGKSRVSRRFRRIPEEYEAFERMIFDEAPEWARA
jgi:hypothetical protein